MKTFNGKSILMIISLFIIVGLAFSSCQKEDLQTNPQTEVENMQQNQRNNPGTGGGNGLPQCYHALVGINTGCTGSGFNFYILDQITYSSTACWNLVNSQTVPKGYEGACLVIPNNACKAFPCP